MQRNDSKSENKQPAIVSIGAGKNQVPLIQAAGSLGFSTIAVDRDPKAPGFAMASHTINCSTHEFSAVKQGLHEVSNLYDLKGVVARTTGQALHTAASVSKEFSLPGLTGELAKLSTEKSTLRKFCMEHDLPAPKGIRLSRDENLTRELSLPCIVKPDFTVVGKKSIKVIWDMECLHEAINAAVNSSFNEFVEIESYIEGFDVACLFWLRNGSPEIIAVWDELVGLEKNGLVFGVGVCVPSIICETEVFSRIVNIVDSFSELFVNANVLLIMSFRVDKEGNPFIIELHGDLGGDLIADELFPAADAAFKYFDLCIKVSSSSSDSVYIPNFKPAALLYKNALLKKDMPGEEFMVIKEPELKELHKSIGRLVDRTIFHDERITSHQTFLKDVPGAQPFLGGRFNKTL